MRKHLVVAITLLTPALGLAACGDSSDSADDGDAVETDDAGVSIEMRDFEFSPRQVESAGAERLTIELENTGGTRHTFTADGVDEEVAPGDSTTVEVEVPDGGLTFVCRFHEGQGMTGSIGVNGGGAGSGGGGEEPAPATEGGGGAPGY